MKYLQEWWKQTYPNAMITDVKRISEISIKDLFRFAQWIEENFEIKKK